MSENFSYRANAKYDYFYE